MAFGGFDAEELQDNQYVAVVLCKDLRLMDCTMEDCDLSFEYSDVQAEIIGKVDSVKNPLSGRIVADSFGEIITDGSVKDCRCEIVRRRCIPDGRIDI